MKFQYFVYFLNPLKQQTLFPDKREKNEILRSLLELKKPLSFESHGVIYAFVFVRKHKNFIIAKFGRQSSIKKSLPPEKNFEEINEVTWPHVNVFINTSNDHESGQQIAFEYNTNIFPTPYSQLKSLADEINSKLLHTGYVISINPVTTEQKFWDVIKANENKIEKISFTFNAPNLFNLKNALEQDLKEVQKDYSLTTAKVEFENRYGSLNIPENEFMQQGAEYISKGGGEYKITIKGKKIISNKKNIKTKTFDNLEIHLEAENNGQKTLMSIIDKIFN